MRAASVAVMLGLVLMATDATGARPGPQDDAKTRLSVLSPLVGTWVAAGDGFSSTLEYAWALPGVLLHARNELKNTAGAVVGQYEGHYMWDAAQSSIVFWTVGGNGELHRGTAVWRDGQLWHTATVSGGRIAGYRSVIAPAGTELHYRAKYEPAATDADVLATAPLVYRPVTR